MRTKAEIATAFAPTEELDQWTNFHLVGIGGAGMSVVARMLLREGFKVSGSDSTESPVTQDLESLGATIYIGHSASNVKERCALVATDAVDLQTNPEVLQAEALGAPRFRRSQVLGWLLRQRKVIAVTGTHGKTTTSGYLSRMLIELGQDPMVVVGARVPEFQGRDETASGEWAVVEACEAYDSFHDLFPNIVVLTNLEMDHSDFHQSFENLQESVLRFVRSLPEDGVLVFCADDPGAAGIGAQFEGKKRGYSLVDWPDGGTGFALPGEHNRLNACAALAVADVLRLDLERAAEALKGFRGAERRLQLVEGSPVPLFDDYAHHPTELVASISAIRERYPDRRIIAAFQPHLYSRTKDNLEAFASALELADYVFITDIYPAREAPIPGISSARIAERIKKPVRYIPSRFALPRAIATEAGEGDVVLVMGAGDIDRIVPEILNELIRPFTGKTMVVYGGSSAEREVSILSANAVQQAMERLKIPSAKIDIFDLLAREKSLELFCAEHRPDVAFLAVHGTHAEDGAIQGLLEMLGVAYTGSGQRACTLAMDKQLAKLIVSKEGVNVPWALMIRRGEPVPGEVEFPLIVKPNSEGSSIGVSRVYDRSELATALDRLWETYEEVLVERLLVGTEISVPVLGSRALPAVELVPASGIYDFAAKYTPGATEEIVPARLPEEVLLRAQEVALTSHRALGCRGATRTDMIVVDGTPWFLELNTLPGLTPTSILPRSAQAAGISFEELVFWIWNDALRSHDLPVPEESR